jgi:hypothetical protein
MQLGRIGRAGALAAAGALLLGGTAFADSVAADGDIVTAGVQTYVDLGTVAPGATIQRDVTMTLFCGGVWHVDPGQVVTLSQLGVTVPSEGGSITATSTTVGPVPPAWADDTAGMSGCSGPLWIDSATPSHVSIVAPTVPGQGYVFTVQYGRSYAPAGVNDASSITGFTSVSFVLAVADADTVPPTFAGPPPNVDVVTADPAGVAVAYDLPVATDDRDPAPTVTCDPAPGSVFPIGVTAVTCTATDAAGNQASVSFDIDVHLASVTWEDPVHDGMTVTQGRSLPIKARAWLDGAELSGTAGLAVTSCEGLASSAAMLVNASQQLDAGRWMAILDTAGLAVGCNRVTLVGNGVALGSFTLEIAGPSMAAPGSFRGGSRPS